MDEHIRQYSMAAPPSYYVRDDMAHESKGVAPDAGPHQGFQRFRTTASEIEAQYGLALLRRKKVIRPHYYTTEVSPVRVPANGSAVATIRVRKEADFEIHKISAVADLFENLGAPNTPTVTAQRGDDFTYRMTLLRKQNSIMNQPIHNLLGTGSGVFPLVLPDAAWMDHASAVRIEFFNRRAFPIEIFFTLSGLNYYYREFDQLTNVIDFTRLSRAEKEFFVASKKKFIEAYMYTLDNESITLAAGASGSETIRIRQEADFEAMYVNAFANGPFRFRIRETNTGRFITSVDIHSDTGTGEGTRPYLLPESLWLDNNSTVEIDFENLDDDSNEIFFTLIGRQWYDTPSQNLTAGPDLFYEMYRALPGLR